jgi:peroxiredoxin
LVGLRDLARAYPDVRFFAISPDASSVSKQLAKQIESDGRGPLGFSLLADAKSEVIDRYGLRDPAYAKEKINGVPRPTVLVLDEKGTIRWSKTERDYRERPTNEQVAAAIDSVE